MAMATRRCVLQLSTSRTQTCRSITNRYTVSQLRRPSDCLLKTQPTARYMGTTNGVPGQTAATTFSGYLAQLGRERYLSSGRTRIQPLRYYSSQESSALGSIGDGEAGSAETLLAPEHLNEKEREIFEKLRDQLQPATLEVQDISGGCGSMYGIDIVSTKFKGLSMLKQQRLVNEVLGEEIKSWHGVQLKTRAP